MSTSLTIGQWEEASYPMIWSIYDEESYAKSEILIESNSNLFIIAYKNILLDLSAPDDIPDGVHNVYYYEGDLVSGVTVKDREFVPGPTVDAVLETVCSLYRITGKDVKEGREGLDHVYIEGFEWDKERQAIQVHLGS